VHPDSDPPKTLIRRIIRPEPINDVLEREARQRTEVAEQLQQLPDNPDGGDADS
jgi:hypothetical protein